MRDRNTSAGAGDWAIGFVVILTVALLAGACASGAERRAAVAGNPIESVASIAGTWEGTLEFGAGEQPCTLTIEPGGRAVIQGRTITQYGTVSVAQGKGSYSFPGRSDGTLTLYQDGGKRQLQLKGTSGTFDARVSPK